LFKKILILGIGRLVTTEYRVLPSIRYLAEPSNRTEYRFSPIKYSYIYTFKVTTKGNSLGWPIWC